MEIIVAGPRDLHIRTSQIYAAMFRAGYEPTCILQGGAKGVDAAGKQYAEDLGLPCICYPAEWINYGKGAGPIRNRQMAEIADALLVFIHKGRPITPGTASMIAEATRAKIPIHLEEA